MEIRVTDKVEDFVEVKCYALNCILKMFPRPSCSQRKFEVETRVKSLFRCFFLYNIIDDDLFSGSISQLLGELIIINGHGIMPQAGFDPPKQSINCV